MSTPLTPQSIRNIGVYGIIRQQEVDDKLIPEGAITEAINFHFDRKGAATIRSGLATLGSTAAIGASGFYTAPCIGLHNAQAGTLVAVFSNGSTSAIYTYNGSAWSASLDGGTASVRVRFVDFGSYTLALNFIHNTYSSIRFWNAGSSRHWHHTGNPINPQNMWGYAPTLGEVFKSRIYLGGDDAGPNSGQNASNPSRLFFSSVISSTGNITWSPTVDYVDINPGDGEKMTGLKRYSLELLVFKPNYIYRFRTSGVDPDPLIKIGTRSQESIVEGKKGIYFHHDTAFYRYAGGYPEEISRPISDIVDAIPFGQFDDIVAWNDNDHIYWSVGNLTIANPNGSSETWQNIVLRYTESSDLWTIYSYSSDIRRGSHYNSGSNLTRVVGTDYGVVATHNSGTTDLGHPIEYRLIDKWREWEGISTQKLITQLIALCEKAQGLELSYQIDDDQAWHPLLQMRKYSTYHNKPTKPFHRVRFKVSGTTKWESSVFLGIEILDGVNEGIV